MEPENTIQEPVGDRHLRGMKRRKPRQVVASKRVKNAWNKTKTGLSLRAWAEGNSSPEVKQWLKNKSNDAINSAKALREKNKGTKIAAEKLATKSARQHKKGRSKNTEKTQQKNK